LQINYVNLFTKMRLTKKQILENRQVLKEDTLENILMVAGFVPVIGEIADIILIIRYIYKKEYIYAALMLIALIPTVGDFIVKPFIRVLKGAGIAGKTALRSSDDLAKYLMQNPSAKEQFLKMSKHFDDAGVKQTINSVGGINKGWAQKMTDGLGSLKSTASKLRPVQLTQRIGKEIATQPSAGYLKMLAGKGPVATGLKAFFREEKLAQYVAKKGMEPSNWLSKWWNITRTARQSRRDMFRSVVALSGVAKMFGLPNLSMNQLDEMMKDEKFREALANDPQVSQYIAQNTSQDDINNIEGTTNTSGFNPISSLVGIGLLKTLAQRYV
jgi:hypothetical protein